MANIQISSPFLRAFTHSDTTISTSVVTVLAAAVTPERRIVVIIQNQHATAVVTVILNTTGSSGIKLKAGETISLDNYNGIVRCSSTTSSTVVHIAYATA
jgi:hypothetical protein